MRGVLVAAVMLLCTPAWAGGDEVVLTDAKGHYIVYDAEDLAREEGGNRAFVYVGDRKGLFRYAVRRRTRDSTSGYSRLELPTKPFGYGEIDLNATPLTLTCPDGEARTLLRVSGKDRDKVLKLKRAEHERYPWDFWALGRDLEAHYYYVEKSTRQVSNYRLYVGERAKMKRQKLIRIADDHEGQLLVTRTGTLQLDPRVAGFDPNPNYRSNEVLAHWRPKKGAPEPLTILPQYKGNTSHLAYDELGIHLGVAFGDPCSLFR